MGTVTQRNYDKPCVKKKRYKCDSNPKAIGSKNFLGPVFHKHPRINKPVILMGARGAIPGCERMHPGPVFRAQRTLCSKAAKQEE
jgi:hypothetical protein